MSKCPNCFRHLPDGQYAWICTTGRCEQTVDDFASRFSAFEVRNGTRYALARPLEAKRNWAPPHDVACPSCLVPMSDACPSCHHPLLPGWRLAQVTCIAMSGARATGKSLYVAVMVKQLEVLAMQLGTVLAFGDDVTRETYRKEYEEPLYVERGLMSPTPKSNTVGSYQRHPLVFSLGMIGGVRRFFVVRDIAGEDMENPENTGQLDFLAQADGIFFMFDTLAVDNVRAKLVDLIPAQLMSGGDPLIVLGNLLRMLGSAAPRLAIILSKFDALQELRRVDDVDWSAIMSNPGAAFLRNPIQTTPAYDRDDGALLHEEVKSLLYRLNAGGIVLTLENPHGGQKLPYRFFATSALGESPDGRQVNARGIAPFRCLDPVKWVFDSVGVI